MIIVYRDLGRYDCEVFERFAGNVFDSEAFCLPSGSRWSKDPPRMKSRRRLGVIAWLLLFAVPLHSQKTTPATYQEAVTASRYADSAEGLRLFLLDVFAAAKSEDNHKVAAFLRDTEIPNFQKWFTKMYGKERGRSWAEPYGRELNKNEAEMQNSFTKLAAEDGEVVTRKVNDSPKGGEGGLEWGMVHTAKQRVDFFYAEWKPAATSADAQADPIGYFLFIDGKFRWDSTIHIIPIRSITTTDLSSPVGNLTEAPTNQPTVTGNVFRPGKDGVGYPSCGDCPVPAYTQEARDAKFQGTVMLQVVIGPDGRATDIKVLKKGEYGLEESAVQAVHNWRFKPALGPNGKPVAVILPIEVAFRLR